MTVFPYWVTQPLTSTTTTWPAFDVANETVRQQTPATRRIPIYAFAETNVWPTRRRLCQIGARSTTAVHEHRSPAASTTRGELRNVHHRPHAPTGHPVTWRRRHRLAQHHGHVAPEPYPKTNGTARTVTGRTCRGLVVVHARAVCAGQQLSQRQLKARAPQGPSFGSRLVSRCQLRPAIHAQASSRRSPAAAGETRAARLDPGSPPSSAPDPPPDDRHHGTARPASARSTARSVAYIDGSSAARMRSAFHARLRSRSGNSASAARPVPKPWNSAPLLTCRSR